MKKIKLTQGKYALVDDEDYPLLSKYKWHAWKDPNRHVWYAKRSVHIPKKESKTGKYSCKVVKMHCQVMGQRYIDHINRNGLDNRRCNLRAATNSQNMQNRTKRRNAVSSSYVGVYWDKQMSKFRSRIRIDGKSKHLGLFDNEVDAAKAYDLAARELYGEHAHLNFPWGHST